MNEIKVSVSFVLQGGIMLTQAEAEQLEKEKKGTGFEFNRLKVEDKKGNKEVITFLTRKNRTTTRSINIFKEAYDYMVSMESCPSSIKRYMWLKMNKNQRLEAHLNLLKEDFHAISYTYKVFDD